MVAARAMGANRAIGVALPFRVMDFEAAVKEAIVTEWAIAHNAALREAQTLPFSRDDYLTLFALISDRMSTLAPEPKVWGDKTHDATFGAEWRSLARAMQVLHDVMQGNGDDPKSRTIEFLNRENAALKRMIASTASPDHA